jgi:hypothetical protein
MSDINDVYRLLSVGVFIICMTTTAWQAHNQGYKEGHQEGVDDAINASLWVS